MQQDEELQSGLNFEESADSDLFHEYSPSKMSVGRPHPDQLIESTSLHAVVPPDVAHQLSLPAHVITDGLLSRPQLEVVMYACQAHAQLLPTLERKAFFLGDGPGVGKGRSLAGIILENWSSGKSQRHLWLSVSADLSRDARRDLGKQITDR